MISCNLKGGLGNMLFQIAFLENASKASGFPSSYPNIKRHLAFLNEEKGHNPTLKHATEYLKMFKNFDWGNSRVDVPIRTTKFPFHYHKSNIVDRVCYDGFFQSELYFPDREFILHQFEPSDFVTAQLKKYDNMLNGTACSIHIRIGDYVRLARHHALQPNTYFEEAIKYIGEVDTYLVFSDDMDLAKSMFIDSDITPYYIENEKDYIEIFLQSKCTHNIISNSSFSWWGAWLNTNINKKVVGPSIWFGPSKKLITKDIIPESWKIIGQ